MGECICHACMLCVFTKHAAGTQGGGILFTQITVAVFSIVRLQRIKEHWKEMECRYARWVWKEWSEGGRNGEGFGGGGGVEGVEIVVGNISTNCNVCGLFHFHSYDLITHKPDFAL